MPNRHPGLLAILLLGLAGVLGRSADAQISMGLSITLAPPPLPVYEQPEIPGDGYLWIPGYWAWDVDSYYWVPGTWVEPPQAGYLWTPGYWGWGQGVYLWHAGYWGEHVGFYGGVDYGHGYGGSGYQGGYWDHDRFYYNRDVNNVRGNAHITTVYNRAVNSNVGARHVSYNGGQGGIRSQPTADERTIEHESHVNAVPEQIRHEQFARTSPALHASVNHGQPPFAAMARPGAPAGAHPQTPTPQRPDALATTRHARSAAGETPRPAPMARAAAPPRPQLQPAPRQPERPMPLARAETLQRPQPRAQAPQQRPMPIARAEAPPRPQQRAEAPPQQRAQPQRGNAEDHGPHDR